MHSVSRIYTRAEIASAVLDMIGWRSDVDLSDKRLLEPSAGAGVFACIAAERLVESRRARGLKTNVAAMAKAIRAYEIFPRAAAQATANIKSSLIRSGLTERDAGRLAAVWVKSADFLLESQLPEFTHIVGNPPYVRWSKIPSALRMRYESALPPRIARGDLCAAFLYKCADLLAHSGTLGFVCSDRWLRTAYGAELRAFLGELVLTAHLEIHDMHAFDRMVDAYAAITLLKRTATKTASRRTWFARPQTLRQLHSCARSLSSFGRSAYLRRIDDPLRHTAAISIPCREQERALRDAELRFPSIEDAGCRVRVGAALGHTPAFVLNRGEAERLVERELLLPYVSSRDIQEDGTVRCTRSIINVFRPDKDLIDLKLYPRARRHLLAYKSELSNRSCVHRRECWYRTIDCIDHNFARTPKILIAGIALHPRMTLAFKTLQPGNSVYALLSSEWPLLALYRVLKAGILGLFANAYSPRISGNCLRFHGVVLKKIRLPYWHDVPDEVKRALLKKGKGNDLSACVARLYGMPKLLLRES